MAGDLVSGIIVVQEGHAELRLCNASMGRLPCVSQVYLFQLPKQAELSFGFLSLPLRFCSMSLSVVYMKLRPGNSSSISPVSRPP